MFKDKICPKSIISFVLILSGLSILLVDYRNLPIAVSITIFLLSMVLFAISATLGFISMTEINSDPEKKLKGKVFAIFSVFLGSVLTITLIMGTYQISDFLSNKHKRISIISQEAKDKLAKMQLKTKQLQSVFSISTEFDNFLTNRDFPPVSLEDYNNSGYYFYSKHDYSKAIYYYTLAIKNNSMLNAIIYHNRARAYLDSELYNLALADLEQSLGIYPKYYDARQDKAVVFRLTGEYDKSIKALEEILKDYPDAAKSWVSLGLAYEKKGNCKKAKKYYQKAVKLRPNWEFPKKKITQCQQ